MSLSPQDLNGGTNPLCLTHETIVAIPSCLHIILCFLCLACAHPLIFLHVRPGLSVKERWSAACADISSSPLRYATLLLPLCNSNPSSGNWSGTLKQKRVGLEHVADLHHQEMFWIRPAPPRPIGMMAFRSSEFCQW